MCPTRAWLHSRSTALCVFILLLFSATLSWAQNAQDDETVERPRSIWTFVLAEGLIAANSGIATAAPEVFGAAGLLMTPLAARGVSMTEDVAGMSLWASLCLYNIIAPSSLDLTDGDVFVHNLVGWHIIALGLFVVDVVSDDVEPEGAGSSFEVTMTPAGMKAGFVGRF